MTSADYQRGYAAGRKRQKVDIDYEAYQQKLAEKFNAAFLAVLPACMDTDQNWQRGDKPLRTIKERASLAAEMASVAVEYMR